MAEKKLCFIIEKEKLYLEQVLVDYMDVPIFFLCKGENQYYITLCIDFDELTYVVVKLPLKDVYKLLHSEIPMRDVILKQREYWLVYSGNEISQDKVIRHEIKDMDESLLPEKKACFKVLTTSMEDYVKKFDREFFATENYTTSKINISWNETQDSFLIDAGVRGICHSTKLFDWKIENCKNMKSFFYAECLETPVPTNMISFTHTDMTEQLTMWKDSKAINIAYAS